MWFLGGKQVKVLLPAGLQIGCSTCSKTLQGAEVIFHLVM
jgi:hypothetical protein